MGPEHFGKRNLCVSISEVIICLFSANMFWSNLWSKRKRPKVLHGVQRGSFQQQIPCSRVGGASNLHKSQISNVSFIQPHLQGHKWQSDNEKWVCSRYHLLLSYIHTVKMFDFPLQKKKMCYQQSALPCTFSWDRRDASANIWADVKAVLKKWALMRISFQFGGK